MLLNAILISFSKNFWLHWLIKKKRENFSQLSPVKYFYTIPPFENNKNLKDDRERDTSLRIETSKSRANAT